MLVKSWLLVAKPAPDCPRDAGQHENAERSEDDDEKRRAELG
jgi:hypothetical protein